MTCCLQSGDTIWFRGQRRFVVLVTTSGLNLKKIRKNSYPSPVAHYSIGATEKKTIRVLRRSTKKTAARARRLFQAIYPGTKIRWSPDGQPTFIHRTRRSRGAR